MKRGAALLLWCALQIGALQAHVASNGFVEVQVRGRDLTGSLELAVRDVELAIGVDTDRDRHVTWGELRSSEPRLVAYVAQRFALLVRDSNCAIRFGALAVNPRVDGNYAWLPFTGHCPAEVRDLRISYRLLEDVDPSHRGLLTLAAGPWVQTAVLGGHAAPSDIALDQPSPVRAFGQYLEAGTWHIWNGIDHLLFLVSLLLPAVLVRRSTGWEPVAGARPALLGTLKVVTAFTIAHSITLSLAALNVVRLPSRLTESVIAASIVVAALNNIFPIVTETRARIAFAFGLLHGFGFASVLADMGLPSGARLVSLLGFNCGIEAGQLAVVLAVMPIAYLMREVTAYRRALLPWGSAGVATLALVWFIRRAFFPT